MAAAKKRKSKKAARKATSKPQKAAKRLKVAKAKGSAAKPQDATGGGTNGFQNPFRSSGNYWASIEALRSLGVGRLHPFAQIVGAVKKSMGANWKAFAEKDSRSKETGKDAEHRILQNVSVLARKDYGKPLRGLGYEVRWDGREKLAGLFKIESK
jgi:hypothetical protein